MLLLMVSLASCTTDMQEVKRFSEEHNGPDLYATNFRTDYSTNAKLSARLSAPVVQKFMGATPYYEFPNGIELLFFDDNKKVKTSLTAEYAIFFETNELGKATGNVIITNADSTILRTEEIYIDQKNDSIYNNVPVKINEVNGYEINGRKGFVSNLDFTIYKFRKAIGKIPFEGEFEKIEAQKNE